MAGRLKEFQSLLTLLPSWLLTAITLGVILWLTLASKPLGDEPPSLFPGADKVAHGIMFGGLTWMMMLDNQRKNEWKPVSVTFGIISALSSSAIGVIVEFAQLGMQNGRGFEYADMISDAIGAFLFMGIWLMFQKRWAREI